ncbi:MAG: lysophospholipid acyltransferase family protein [Desulfovibrionaceae bacterium]
MLRTILFYIFVLPFTMYYVLLMDLMSYGRNSQAWGEKLGPGWSKWILRTAGIKVETDFSALDPKGHYVFMANHSSNMDISVVYYHIGKRYPIRFVAKQSLWKVPFFGRCMEGAGHIPIDRSNRRAGMKSVEEAVKTAQGGICPVIFPEGTRAQDRSRLQEFKIGGIVLALKCGLPVAPLIIDGMGDTLPKGSLRLHGDRKVRIRALEPIDPAGYTLKDRERFKQELYDRMNAEYVKMRAERI